ncbi:MAG: hypothetical protein CBD16_01060, partial [Betaproteobacteria bacterium TMED156]
MDLFFASLFTIFLWWASTSILLAFTRNESEESSFSTIFVSTCILLLGFVILISSSDSTTVTSAYLGFVSVLMIWSWQEAAFLVGWITGTRTTACPNNVTGFKRAWLAFQTISHHELLLVVLGIVIWLVTFNSPNDIGIQTFLILWIMRISAKLNVFLGVRNFYEEFLPSNLS